MTNTGMQHVIPGTEQPIKSKPCTYKTDGNQFVILGAECISTTEHLFRLFQKPLVAKWNQIWLRRIGCLGSGYSFALKSGRDLNVFFSATKIIHCRNSQATSLNKWRPPPDPPVGSLYEVRGFITFATVLTIYDVEGEGDTLALINKRSV